MKEMLFTLLFSNILFTSAKAAESEPNNTKAQANALSLNGSDSGKINAGGDEDWWKITTNSDGLLKITLKGLSGRYMSLSVYDNDGVTVLNSADNINPKHTIKVDGLSAGIYYIRITCANNGDTSGYNISNTLTAAAPANDIEPNGTAEQAGVLPLNGIKTGHAGYYYNHVRDSSDWYKVTTNANGELDLNLEYNYGDPYISIALYDGDKKNLLGREEFINSSKTMKILGTAAGIYYVKIYCSLGDHFATYTLSDTLIKPVYASDAELNNSPSTATTLPANTASYGNVGFYFNHYRDTADWYKINYTGNSGALSIAITFDTSIDMYYFSAYIYKDTNAFPIFHKDYITGDININLSSLSKGYYYVKLFATYDFEFDAYSITPIFTQTKAHISTSSYNNTFTCDNNMITYRLRGSSAPYTVQLYRFQKKYGNAKTSNDRTVTFDHLPNGIYYATVYGDGGTGPAKGKSDTISLMPVPTNTQTLAIKSTQAKFNWVKVTCAAYDSVEYRVRGSGAFTKVATMGNVSNYILTGLTPSTSYDWRVAAVDTSNGYEAVSAFTDIVTFTTTATGFIAGTSGEEDNLSLGNGKLNKLIISPNPASSYFTIHINTTLQDKLTATLYDVNGKAVWTSGSINADALNNKQVSVNQFGSGLYSLRITNAQGAIVGTTKVSVVK